MKNFELRKAGTLAIVIIVLFVACWELYWRSQSYEFSFNDDESRWAFTRKQVYDTSPARPVIIGSSRVKFDIHLSEWGEASGYEPVQLALVGTSPRPVLSDLANDPDFNGTVLIGVTEGLFFATDGSLMEERARKRITFYPKWSLSQQISFHMNSVLERAFVFLDDDRFTLNSLLKRIPIQSRPGVFVFPNFPLEMGYTLANRQEVFSQKFVSDTAVQHQVQNVWKFLGMTDSKYRAVSGDTLTHIIVSVKESVDKIKARGGKVLFLRMPSSDPVWSAEQQIFPRELYWDRLLKDTQSEGIHFADYPQLSKYKCPDWSHLTSDDTHAFTADLIKIIEAKTGWSIRKSSVSNP